MPRGRQPFTHSSFTHSHGAPSHGAPGLEGHVAPLGHHEMIQQFDPQEGNYWGYMTLHCFSPHQPYAHGETFGEFRAMVQAFHRAGIEVT